MCSFLSERIYYHTFIERSFNGKVLSVNDVNRSKDSIIGRFGTQDAYKIRILLQSLKPLKEGSVLSILVLASAMTVSIP